VHIPARSNNIEVCRTFSVLTSEQRQVDEKMATKLAKKLENM